MRHDLFLKLNSLNVIRTFFSSSAGYGDQVVVVHAMEKTRQLGFDGVFHVVYEDTSIHKLVKLFEIDDPVSVLQSYYSPKEKLIFTSFSHFIKNITQFDFLELGFGMPNSMVNIAEITKTKLFVHVFGLLTDVNGAGGAIFAPGSNKAVNMLFPVASPEKAIGYLSGHVNNLNQGLVSVLNGLKNKKLNVLPVYGLNFVFERIRPEFTFAKLVAGVLEAQRLHPQLSQNPTIILVLNTLSAAEFKTIQQFILDLPHSIPVDANMRHNSTEVMRAFTLGSSVQFLARTQADISRVVQNLSERMVLVMDTGGDLPRNVFDAFMSSSNFPPVQEGTSSHDFLLNARRPFMHCNADLGAISSSGLTLQTEILKHICSDKFFSSEQLPHQVVAEYLAGTQDPHSEIMRSWFKLFGEFNAPEKDRMLVGLEYATGQLLEKDQFNRQHYQQLMHAIATHQSEEVLSLINEQGACLFAPHPTMQAPLAELLNKHRFDIFSGIDLKKQPNFVSVTSNTVSSAWSFLLKKCDDVRLYRSTLTNLCRFDLSQLLKILQKPELETVGRIHFLIAVNDLNASDELLKLAPHLINQVFNGVTPLKTAIATGNISMIELLQKYGATFEMSDLQYSVKYGFPIFNYVFNACRECVHATVELISEIAKNGDVAVLQNVLTQMKGRDLVNKDHLFMALRHNNSGVASVIAGVLPSCNDNKLLSTALSSGQLESVKVMVEQCLVSPLVMVGGENIRIGQTPLFFLAQNLETFVYLTQNITPEVCAVAKQSVYYPTWIQNIQADILPKEMLLHFEKICPADVSLSGYFFDLIYSSGTLAFTLSAVKESGYVSTLSPKNQMILLGSLLSVFAIYTIYTNTAIPLLAMGVLIGSVNHLKIVKKHPLISDFLPGAAILTMSLIVSRPQSINDFYTIALVVLTPLINSAICSWAGRKFVGIVKQFPRYGGLFYTSKKSDNLVSNMKSKNYLESIRVKEI